MGAMECIMEIISGQLYHQDIFDFIAPQISKLHAHHRISVSMIKHTVIIIKKDIRNPFSKNL